MSQSSQQWKKPTDIMRTRQQKKRKSAELLEPTRDSASNNERNTSDADECRLDGDFGKKRRNPFDVSSSATRRASESEREKSTVQPDIADTRSETRVHTLFSALNNADQKLQDSTRKSGSRSIQKEKCQVGSPGSKPLERGGGEHTTQPVGVVPSPFAESDDPQTNQRHGVIPVDWSLKIKLRVISQNALISAPLSSAVKARALTHFVHNAPVPDSSPEKLDDMLRSLQQCCHYWVHPCLPGFPVFPRVVSQASLRKQVMFDANGKPELQKALYSSWLESFGSVYQQLKTGHCPYFYLCCHQFTALFCASTISGHGHMTACLSPTTRGLREALRREDVEFTMPNQRSSSMEGKSTAKDGPSAVGNKNQESPGQAGDDNGDDDNDEEDDDDITATDEGASLWLQDVGLDKKCFPTLEPGKVKIQREGYQQVDGRAESLVWCRAGAVQALYNFLINCRSCSAVTGPQAGIPPTILAPTAFVGAALKANKIQQSLARVSTGSVTDDGHVVEISGPLLPHHVLNITALLQDIKDNSAVISVNTHEPTVPFNFTFTNPTQHAASASDRPSTVYGVNASSKLSPGGSIHTLNIFSPTCPPTPGQQNVGKESTPCSGTGGQNEQQATGRDGRPGSGTSSNLSPCSLHSSETFDEDPDIVTDDSPPGTPQYPKKTQDPMGRVVGRNCSTTRRDSCSRPSKEGEIVTLEFSTSKGMETPDIVNPRHVSPLEGPSEVGRSPAVDTQGDGHCQGVGAGGAVDSDTWDKGLHCSVRYHLSVPTTLPAGTAVREIRCRSGSVTWSD